MKKEKATLEILAALDKDGYSLRYGVNGETPTPGGYARQALIDALKEELVATWNDDGVFAYTIDTFRTFGQSKKFNWEPLPAEGTANEVASALEQRMNDVKVWTAQFRVWSTRTTLEV